MIFTDISHARFEGADCVVGIVAGVDICDLSVIIIQSLSKNYVDDWKIMIKPHKYSVLLEYVMIVNLVLNRRLFKKLI